MAYVLLPPSGENTKSTPLGTAESNGLDQFELETSGDPSTQKTEPEFSCGSLSQHLEILMTQVSVTSGFYNLSRSPNFFGLPLSVK